MIYLLIAVLVYLTIGGGMFAVVILYIREMRTVDEQCATTYQHYHELRGWLKARAWLEAGATIVFLWLPVVCGWKRFNWLPRI